MFAVMPFLTLVVPIDFGVIIAKTFYLSPTKDVNDNPPTFEKRVSDVFLSEATRPNTQFLKVLIILSIWGPRMPIRFIFKFLSSCRLRPFHSQVLASDADEGVNRKISFKLSSASPSNSRATSLFGVYPNTGFLYVRKKLQAERDEKVVLLVVASDVGTPSLSATATVLVHVQRLVGNMDFDLLDHCMCSREMAGCILSFVNAYGWFILIM